MESIINKYRSQGKLKNWFQFENGSWNDLITGVAPSSTPAKLDNVGLTDNTSYTTTSPTGEFTVFAKVDWKYDLGSIIINMGTFQFYNWNAGYLSIYDGSALRQISCNTVGAKSLAFRMYSKVATFFKDGIIQGTIQGNNDPGNNYTIGSAKNRIKQLLIFTVALTDTEMAQVHAELESMKFQKKPTTLNVAKNSTYPRKERLVFKPTMLKDGIIRNEINGAVGTVTGSVNGKTTEYGDLLSNNNTVSGAVSIVFPDDASYSFTDNIFSVSFWMRPNDNVPKAIIAKFSGSNYEWALGSSDTAGSLWASTFVSDGSANVYAGNTYLPFTVGKMDMWTITADGLNLYTYRNKKLIATQARVGTNSMSNTAATLSILNGYPIASAQSNADVKINGIWNCALTASEIEELYNATSPQFKTEFGSTEAVAVTAGGMIDGSNYKVIAGAAKEIIETVNGKKCKVLEVTADATVINLPSSFFLGSIQDAAYGKFKWMFYAGATGGECIMNFISNTLNADDANAYSIYYNGSGLLESIGVVLTSTAYLTRSSANAYPRGAWYEIEVDRTATGIFTTKINGVMLTSGTSGSNPSAAANTITTSKNGLLFKMRIGDKIVLSDSQGQQGFNKK